MSGIAPPPRSGASRSALWLLAAGAAVGVAAAAWGLLSADARPDALPRGAVAAVNGRPILASDYRRILDGVASDSRWPLTDGMRRRVLDRMIDEELLVQRGVSLGLVESDRRVRGDITAAMIQSVVVESEDQEPSEQTLRDFYRKDEAFFRVPGRLRVGQVFFRVPDPGQEEAVRSRAARSRERLLAGEPLDQVRRELGDAEVSPIPDALLPPNQLRTYVGPAAVAATLDLEPGGVSAPIRSGMGYHVLVLEEREPPRTPPFEEVREQVRAEWIRRAGDRALERYLAELRERAHVVLAPGAGAKP
jgi:hypothetical protein